MNEASDECIYFRLPFSRDELLLSSFMISELCRFIAPETGHLHVPRDQCKTVEDLHPRHLRFRGLLRV